MGVSEDLEAQVQQAELAVTKQGDTVRTLKALLKEGKGDKVIPRICKSTLYMCHANILDICKIARSLEIEKAVLLLVCIPNAEGQNTALSSAMDAKFARVHIVHEEKPVAFDQTTPAGTGVSR